MTDTDDNPSPSIKRRLAAILAADNATECAVEIQTIMATRNEAVPESRRMRFRTGESEPAFDLFLEHTRAFLAG